MGTQRTGTFGTREAPRRHGSLGVGIVGLGFIGGVHARAVHASGARLVGVVGRDPEAARSMTSTLGADQAFDSVEELLAWPDVDVLHVCTPNQLHVPIARAALLAGKHVVCEKPLATTAEDADGLASLAKERGLVATVPFVYRFHPMVREIQGRVADGSAGPIRLVHGSYLQDWMSMESDDNWRVDPTLGGASRTFADIGVHWCDLMEYVTGHRIVRVMADLVRAVPGRSQTEDAATVLFRTDQGASGSLVVSQISPGRKNRLWISVDGAQHSLEFNQEEPETLWVGARDENRVLMRGGSTACAEAQRLSILPAGHPQGYQDCFNAFVADTYSAIAGDEPAGLPRFADGLRASLLTHAVLESARTAGWVEIPTGTPARTPSDATTSTKDDQR